MLTVRGGLAERELIRARTGEGRGSAGIITDRYADAHVARGGAVRRSSRRMWRPARRAARRVIPTVWASASDTVRIVAGTARLNAASPRRENALRRDIISDLISSLISNLP